uniref:Uncharacterized protein AlNc14C1G171 n=1 Tax=Albugo laibachii Nc14 TaxID=890382 RepID=F0VZ30_9STRA|nr:conserved hypothetical protein [Albugo laibachii Nc14]|eukprot:CCA14045.1 conserved hypothetical protein [Albugo laibachii Nc14]
MLRKLLHGSATTNASEVSDTSTNESRTDLKNHEDGSLNDSIAFSGLITKLDTLECRLRSMVQNWSKYCQAILDMTDSICNVRRILDLDESNTELVEIEERRNVIEKQISQFQNNAIGSLQATLLEIPILKLRNENRKSALNLIHRYQRKIDDLTSHNRSETARLHRNRIKLLAASSRYKELDDSLRAEVSIILNRDVQNVIKPWINKLLMAQQTLCVHLQLQSYTFKQQYVGLSEGQSSSSNTSIIQPEKYSEETLHENINNTGEKAAAVDAFSRMPVQLTPPKFLETEIKPDTVRVIPKRDIDETQCVQALLKPSYGVQTQALHELIETSMINSIDVIECVQLPEGYTLEEWVSVHVPDFYNDVNLLYGTISEFCTTQKCPKMSAGPCYTYLWAEPRDNSGGVRGPTSLPASEYVSRLLAWVRYEVSNAAVFPENGRFDEIAQNKSFMDLCRTIMKRLFRVYAHLYHSHIENFVALCAETHLNFCFKRFLFFVKLFQLVEEKELHALRRLIDTFSDIPTDDTELSGDDTSH